MVSKLSRLCDGILEAGWLFALVTTPLFFNIHTERVFEPDKLTLLRSIALLMLAVWLVKWVDARGWQQLKRLNPTSAESVWRVPFVLPIVVLMAVYAISTLFSVTPRVSWAGSYQRLQGTYTTLSYVAIFAIMLATIQTRQQVRRVVTAVILTTIPIGFYGLMQHYGLNPLPWGGDVEARVAGHMGNAIFIAAYLIMVTPLTLARILDAFTNILSDKQLAFSDVFRAALYVFVLALQLLTIYWSGSRGPLLGLLAGLFAFTLVLLVSLRNSLSGEVGFRAKDAGRALLLLLPPIVVLVLSRPIANATSALIAFWLFAGAAALSVLAIFVLMALRRGWQWLWLSWIGLTLFMAGWLLLFNVPQATTDELADAPVVGGLFETLGEWKSLPTIGSYGRMLDPTQTVGREKSNRVRVLIWEGVVDLLTPHEPLTFPDGSSDSFNILRPLIGYGPESMYVVYNRFYPPELATVEARNASPDRAHNETFDALVITGLLGFLAWQALYVSVFVVAFRYLGVVGSKRDRNVLIGAWIVGALLGLIGALLIDPIYLGVAIPTGSIVGLVAYLIYYALTARGGGADVTAPFQVDRLLMLAVVSAVVAHFVEIHFGIAISATRLLFFVFLALIVLLTRQLPEKVERPVVTRRSKRTTATATPSAEWGPIVLWMCVLALTIGMVAFEFMTYVLPPDKVVQTGADLTSAEIFYQSLFLNATNGFVSSPFVYAMMVVTWGLGMLVVLSEMVKNGQWRFEPGELKPLPPSQRNMAMLGLGIMAAVGVVWRFFSPASAETGVLLGRSMALVWALLALWALVRLVDNSAWGRLTAAAICVAGLIVVLPTMVAGGVVFAALTGILCAAVLWLIWSPGWRRLFAPALVLGIGSFAIGIIYSYFHAVLVREVLLYLVFIQGIEPISTLYELFFAPDPSPTSIDEVRVLEAMQAVRYLTFFYLFAFGLLLVAGVALARRAMAATRVRGSGAAIGSAVIAAFFAVILIISTNGQAAAADIVYKRATPYDQEAVATGSPDAWDAAIAVYEEAVRRTPLEDFYYLFLGRALLERATVATDSAEQLAYLNRAEERLLEARAINPLNTDHTANLARLHTRWAGLLASDSAEMADHISQADAYYQQALTLSPQHSVIRNEYGRLALDLEQDCDKAIEIFADSAEIDPFYVDTHFELANAYVVCAPLAADSAEQETLYQGAIDSLEMGLEMEPENGRAWVQAGQVYRRLGLTEQAMAAFERAGEATDPANSVEAWNVAFLQAAALADAGDTEGARALAEEAMATAPAEYVPQVQAFLDGLE